MSTQLGKSRLAYFVRTAEAGQISRAAAALHIAQPALSSAILKLERNVGVELFIRHPRGVSLTPAGARLYEKAKAAVHAEEDAVATAHALARSCRSTIEVGFLGALPELIAPGVLERFAGLRPDAGVTFRELRFPTGPMASWLADVDVALCFSPVADAGVRIHVIREEPRCVLLYRGHPLADRQELLVEDVLNERFCGLHHAIDPMWAGFWSLDDHRGGPPPQFTHDAVTSYIEMVAAAVSARCICVVPMIVAESIAGQAGPLVALPLRDAAPATCALAWRVSAENALTAAFGEMASEESAAAWAESNEVPVAAMPPLRVSSGLAAA
jgi:DNA-binding transcriptional LysR family regulator